MVRTRLGRGEMDDHKAILTVALDPETFERIAPVLKRSSLSVQAVTQASAALDFAAQKKYSLVICRYPLPDLKLREFVSAIRGPSSASKTASLLLLTIPEMVSEARSGVHGGPFMVFSGQENVGTIGQGTAHLLQVAPRHAPRISSRLQVNLEEDTEAFQGWVVDLSVSGMLVTDSPMLSVGSACFFDFTLPTGDVIRGTGTVVRHAAPRREKITGFAIRFVDFQPGCAEALEAWCQGEEG